MRLGQLKRLLMMLDEMWNVEPGYDRAIALADIQSECSTFARDADNLREADRILVQRFASKLHPELWSKVERGSLLLRRPRRLQDVATPMVDLLDVLNRLKLEAVAGLAIYRPKGKIRREKLARSV